MIGLAPEVAIPTPPVVFQSLAGPKLTGPGKSGGWTNCAHWLLQ